MDFRDHEGVARESVIIAGENGSGKTVVLEAIFGAFVPAPYINNVVLATRPGAYLIEVQLSQAEVPNHLAIQPIVTNSALNEQNSWGIKPIYPGNPPAGVCWINWSFDGERYKRFFRWSSLTSAENFGAYGGELVGQVGWRFGRCFYSEANVTFNVPAIGSATARSSFPAVSRPSHAEFGQYRGGSDLTARVAQLFVDIRAADNEDLANWVKGHPGEIVPEGEKEKRFSLFNAAFARMFAGKRMVSVDRDKDQYKVMFEESGRRTTLENLSTGEKQIVFRGSFLLSALNELPGSVTLIDEPELSLHPRWQGKIRQFFYDIIPAQNDRLCQTFIATHSPFIVHESFNSQHVILQRDEGGNVLTQENPEFTAISSTDIAVRVFDLTDFLRGVQNSDAVRKLLIVEGKSDIIHLQTAWKKLGKQGEIPFDICSADGAKNLNTIGRCADALVEGLIRRNIPVIMLFDFDEEGLKQWNGLSSNNGFQDLSSYTEEAGLRKKKINKEFWAYLLPVPASRKEHASRHLAGSSILCLEWYYSDEYLSEISVMEKIAGVEGVERRRITSDSGKKMRFAQAAQDFEREAFESFNVLFDAIGP